MSPGFTDLVTTEWTPGSVVEAAWAMVANHGGGYAYRLCKVPEEGMGGLTEECFTQGHLQFYGDKQWIELGEDRIEIEAVRTREGTFPEGSQWTRNPIPNCLWPEVTGPDGDPIIDSLAAGYLPPDMSTNICSAGYQFPPPFPGLSGFWNFNYTTTSIVDKLSVPSDLPPGDYVLSWRWEAEKSFQIWSTCANIKIVNGEMWRNSGGKSY